jgi:hypothetical protein
MKRIYRHGMPRRLTVAGLGLEFQFTVTRKTFLR